MLEVTHGIAGAYCGKLLSAMGADVVKVEPLPEGDPQRARGPFAPGPRETESGGMFSYLNTNKRGMTLDWESTEGYRLLLALVTQATVFLEDINPSLKENIGLDYAAVSKDHPDLVQVSITPFGQVGPYRDFLADELVLYHMGGLGYVTPRYVPGPDQVPLRAGGFFCQFLGGTYGAAAAAAAVFSQRIRGIGQAVDVAVQESVVSVLDSLIPSLVHEDQVIGRVGQPLYAPQHFLPSNDGWVYVICVEERQWRALTALIGDPEWVKAPEFADGRLRAENWDSLEPLLIEWTSGHSKQELFHLAQAARVPLAPVMTMGEVFADDHLHASGSFAEIPHPVLGSLRIPGIPFHLSGSPGRPLQPAPGLGQHTSEVLAEWLNLPEQQICALRRASIA